MKGQYNTKARPKSYKELQLAIKKGTPIDYRTRVGRTIKEVKTAVREDLSQTAKELLLQDVAFSQTVQQMCVEKAFADPSKVLNTEGYPCRALSTWKNFATLKKASLLALKKFDDKAKPEEPKPKGLGDLIIETSDLDTDTAEQSPDSSVETEPNEQSPDSTAHWSQTLRHCTENNEQ